MLHFILLHSAMSSDGDVSVAEIIIPAAVFGCFAIAFLNQCWSGAYSLQSKDPKHGARNLFRMMRDGWVDANRNSGQAAVNTTRDYFRVILFLAGNSILLATVLAGFVVNKEAETDRELLQIVKIGSCVALFITIFIFLILCTRYLVHFR
jgi:hypothetical protein